MRRGQYVDQLTEVLLFLFADLKPALGLFSPLLFRGLLGMIVDRFENLIQRGGNERTAGHEIDHVLDGNSGHATVFCSQLNSSLK